MTPGDDRPGPRLTRRRLVAGGVAGAGAAAAAGYGRYAVGDEFEEHVAGVLGISVASARSLLEHARGRLGDEKYRLHAAAFVTATTFPGETVLPESARRRAVQRFVGNLVADQRDGLVALGLQISAPGPCQGLLRR